MIDSMGDICIHGLCNTLRGVFPGGYYFTTNDSESSDDYEKMDLYMCIYSIGWEDTEW